MATTERTAPVNAPVTPEAQRLEEQYYMASQWALMGRKLKKHRLAVVSLIVLGVMYALGIFADFIAPYTLEQRNSSYNYATPMRIRIFHDGRLHRPFVYALDGRVNPETLQKEYTTNSETPYPVLLFVKREPYRFWGLFETPRHLFGVPEGGEIHLLGTDRLGRDMFSRVLYGARISLSVGLIGVIVSLIIGIIVGGLSGYFGGAVDNVIQRLIEILRSFPTIPLWMTLSAAVPPNWSPIRVYFAITIILSLISWTGVARVVRGKLLALREEDYAMAAKVAGCTNFQIIIHHLVPGFLSYIIVRLTLSIPQMILGETSLSFLGLGLKAPVVSWGVLLKNAQNVRSIALYPWLLIPVFFVIVTILTFNFIGDGLRDAADPYK